MVLKARLVAVASASLIKHADSECAGQPCCQVRLLPSNSQQLGARQLCELDGSRRAWQLLLASRKCLRASAAAAAGVLPCCCETFTAGTAQCVRMAAAAAHLSFTMAWLRWPP